jgi:long-chain fatty acid transport protein
VRIVKTPLRTLISSAVIAGIAISNANAGGFALYTESSAVAIGNYAAGVAAEGADASIGWYNPAGLVLIKEQQVVLSGVGVFPISKISGTSTFNVIPPVLPPYEQSFDGINGAEPGLVPAIHYALPLTEDIVFGLSIVAPFGLSTNWKNHSQVRYAATHSELVTINVSPQIGGRITRNFSLGAGVDLQNAIVKFNSVIGVPNLSIALGQVPTFLDSIVFNKGHSFGVGFHAGALLMSDDQHSRLGLNYQSEVSHTFHGYSLLTGRLATPGLDLTSPLSILTSDPNSTFRSNNLYSNEIDMPQVITLSGYHDYNEKIALLASVVYTGWDVLRNIELNNIAAFAQGFGQVQVNSNSPQNWRNAWRAAVGANYRYNPRILFRAGIGYDQTPTVDSGRDVRLPDADRFALAIGGHYQMYPQLGIDVGYAHLFGIGHPIIDKTATTPSSSYNVNARSTARADLVGLQATWYVDGVVEPAVMTK